MDQRQGVTADEILSARLVHVVSGGTCKFQEREFVVHLKDLVLYRSATMTTSLTAFSCGAPSWKRFHTGSIARSIVRARLLDR